MDYVKRTFRVFVSSTFSDLKAERDALHRNVFPKLRNLCMQHSCRFQAIDLRWGVRREASLDQKTLRICLKEIERCQQITPRPNFIVILGDRYGWRPLPEEIEAAEFENILKQVGTSTKKQLLLQWYRRDDNAVAPVFELQSRTGRFENDAVWQGVERNIRSILLEVISNTFLSEEEKIKYTASATEQEIRCGAMNIPDAKDHVFCFFRKISNLPTEICAKDFIDLDENEELNHSALNQLSELKSNLWKLLPKNVFEYEAKWRQGKVTTDHQDQFCKDVLVKLSRVIESQISHIEEREPLESEVSNHRAFGRQRSRFFTGRKDTLYQIGEYIRRGMREPFVLYGESGSGKTALMARAAIKANDENPESIVIYRFIGATPESSDGRALLESLCKQIAQVYNDEDPIPTDYNELLEEFPRRLNLATTDSPLVVMLDSLDQLSESYDARNLLWLPSVLPENVRIIVSTLTKPDYCLLQLRNKLSSNSFTQLTPMVESEGEELLDLWLNDAKRKLTATQREHVINKFRLSKGLPLYLKLAFEEARLWKSYTERVKLSPDIKGLINDLLQRLSLDSNHGKTFVLRSLGYLAASKDGLTEDEILDLLSRDSSVLNDFVKRAKHSLPEKRLPVVIWSRLNFDLEPYLTTKNADGEFLMTFYHRQLAEVVSAKYLTGRAKTARHRMLSQYFDSQPFQITKRAIEAPNFRKVTELPYQLTLSKTWDRLTEVLTDFNFLMEKCWANKIYYMEEDYQLAFANLPFVKKNLNEWEKFIRTNRHLLLRGNESWPAYKIFLQLAWEHADQSPVTKAAERWVKQGNCGWFWVRSKVSQRPVNPRASACTRVLEGHDGGVQFVTIVPDNNFVVSGCVDGTMRLWNIRNGRSVMIYRGHTGSVRSCCVVPDGSKIISGSHDCSVRLWNIDSPQCIDILEGHKGWVLKVAVSSNGKHVCSASNDGTVRLWDLNTRECKQIFENHNAEVTSVAWLPEGDRIVSCTDRPGNSLYIWDINTGKCMMKVEAHKTAIRNIAVSATGRMIASASHDQTVRIWDTETGKCKQVLGESYPSTEGHTEWVRDVAFSPDEKKIASVSNDKTLRLWDIGSGDCIKMFEGHVGDIMGVAISADGKSAFTAATKPDNSIRIWDLDALQIEDRPVGHLGRIKSLAISPNGFLAATGSGHPQKDARIWDLQSGACRLNLTEHGGWVTGLAFSPNTQLLVSGSRDGKLRQWDIKTGECCQTVLGHENRVTTITYSVDGDKIISGGWDERIMVSSSMKGKKLYDFIKLPDWPQCLACNSSNQLAAGGLRDGHILVWNIENGKVKRLIKAHKSVVLSVAFSPQKNKLFSLSQMGKIKSWNANTGKLLEEYSSNTLYRRDKAMFSMLLPLSTIQRVSSMTSEIGLCLNSSPPIHWCSDEISATFLGHSLAALEKIGMVHTLKILDIIKGNTIQDLNKLKAGKLIKSLKDSISSRLNREIVMHAFLILSWVFEDRREYNDPLIIDIQRSFALGYEDRDDILNHIKTVSTRAAWYERLNEIIPRSILRIEFAINNNLLPSEGPLFQKLKSLISKARNSVYSV